MHGSATGTATCPTGARVVGGGVQILGLHPDLHVLESYPSAYEAWKATVADFSPTNVVGGGFLLAHAVCMNP